MATKTFNGGMAPYCTPSDMLNMFDNGWLGDLCRDDGTRATPTQLLTDPKMVDALSRAAGDIESALFRSSRYQSLDLSSIPAGSNTAATLRDLNGKLAVIKLRERRAYQEPELPFAKGVEDFLALMASGEKILAFEEVEAAGLPDTQRMYPSSFYANLPNLLTNNAAYWGQRANRRGFPSGGFPGW